MSDCWKCTLPEPGQRLCYHRIKHGYIGQRCQLVLFLAKVQYFRGVLSACFPGRRARRRSTVRWCDILRVVIFSPQLYFLGGSFSSFYALTTHSFNPHPFFGVPDDLFEVAFPTLHFSSGPFSFPFLSFPSLLISLVLAALPKLSSLVSLPSSSLLSFSFHARIFLCTQTKPWIKKDLDPCMHACIQSCPAGLREGYRKRWAATPHKNHRGRLSANKRYRQRREAEEKM